MNIEPLELSTILLERIFNDDDDDLDDDDDDDGDDDEEGDILCWKKNALLSSCEDFDHTLPLPTQS